MSSYLSTRKIWSAAPLHVTSLPPRRYARYRGYVRCGRCVRYGKEKEGGITYDGAAAETARETVDEAVASSAKTERLLGGLVRPLLDGGLDAWVSL